jgi:hypothetical protein
MGMVKLPTGKRLSKKKLAEFWQKALLLNQVGASVRERHAVKKAAAKVANKSGKREKRKRNKTNFC